MKGTSGDLKDSVKDIDMHLAMYLAVAAKETIIRDTLHREFRYRVYGIGISLTIRHE